MSLLPFFIILTAGLIFSETFNRLHLPYVVALIISGILIGPSVFGLVEVNDVLTFLASIGMIFLMFMAGSEIKTDTSEHQAYRTVWLALLNGLIPFLVGVYVGRLLGYSFSVSLILGTIFASSSVAVIIPSLESTHLMFTRLGQTVISATIVEDIFSLVLFSIILQQFTQQSPYPIWLFILVLILLFIGLQKIVPWLNNLYHLSRTGKDMFEGEIRFIFAILLAGVVLFEAIGIHAIAAGFILGMALGNSIKGRVASKIHTMSYGFFIPIFFIVIGLQTDLSVFWPFAHIIPTLIIISTLVSSKIISGYVAGRIGNFSHQESILIGVSTTPQVSTNLAAAFTAIGAGLFDQTLITALIILSIITIFITPALISLLANRLPTSIHTVSAVPEFEKGSSVTIKKKS